MLQDIFRDTMSKCTHTEDKATLVAARSRILGGYGKMKIDVGRV